LNYSRRQVRGGTPLNTLRDTAESQGRAAIQHLEAESARLFQEHHFAEDGTRLPGAAGLPEAPPATCDEQQVHEARRAMQEEMHARGMSEGQVQAAARSPQDTQKPRAYEAPEATVNIYMDDVGVKEQKAQRDRDTAGETAAGATPEPEVEPAGRTRPMTYTSAARIEHAGQGFTLVGGDTAAALRFVLAFLLNNALEGQRLVFFTDGMRHLQDSILEFFAWHPHRSLLLDWFHLIKRCKAELSVGLRGRQLRNQHLKALARLLWYGLVAEAIAYVRAIPEEDIKDRSVLDRLIGYFQRNHSCIPCYALRRRLGLRNSSNPVERTCNAVVARRQKHNGMSWSPQGSLALAAITTVVLNGHIQEWLEQRIIPLAFEQAA
jgi:hypothetical protein